MRIACCIVAAGKGTRLGDEWIDTPKALVPILGRAMLYYSIEAFDDASGLHNDIGLDTFVVTAPPDDIDEFRNLAKIWGFSRPVRIIEGGASRAESVFRALSSLKDNLTGNANPPDMVMIHDCARPCLTADMVKLLLDVARDSTAATLAHPAVDTLRILENLHIAGEVDRETIACLETPQLFPFGRIMELHEQAEGNPELPDDTTLFIRAGETVKVVYHEGSNMKVTYPEDIAAAEGILFQRGWQDVDEGND
jgi:2-C-methyl-D-erythritol 4-phosphate cytidylyltransferase